MSEPLSTILLFAPLILIIWLANQADLHRAEAKAGVWAAAAYTLVCVIFGTVFVIGIVLMLGGSGLVQIGGRSFFSFFETVGDVSPPVVGVREALPTVGLGLSTAALIGILLLWAPIRRWVARVIPLDPHSVVHAVALSFIMLIVLNMVVILAIGLDTVTNLVLEQTAEEEMQAALPSLLGGLWLQQGMMALWALIGVGWLSRRSLGDVLRRLDLRVPSMQQAAIGVGAGLLAVFASMILSGLAAALGLGVDPNVEVLNEALLGPLFGSMAGILTIGFAAALGEETLFRGALQPRFGVLLTTLLFAITHNQYGLSLSTVVVFVAGLIFAGLRLRYNTTTSMLAHATYNTTLGLLAMLAVQVMENTP